VKPVALQKSRRALPQQRKASGLRRRRPLTTTRGGSVAVWRSVARLLLGLFWLQLLHKTHSQASRLLLIAAREGATDEQICHSLWQGFPHLTDPASLEGCRASKMPQGTTGTTEKASSFLRRRPLIKRRCWSVTVRTFLPRFCTTMHATLSSSLSMQDSSEDVLSNVATTFTTIMSLLEMLRKYAQTPWSKSKLRSVMLSMGILPCWTWTGRTCLGVVVRLKSMRKAGLCMIMQCNAVCFAQYRVPRLFDKYAVQCDNFHHKHGSSGNGHNNCGSGTTSVHAGLQVTKAI